MPAQVERGLAAAGAVSKPHALIGLVVTPAKQQCHIVSCDASRAVKPRLKMLAWLLR